MQAPSCGACKLRRLPAGTPPDQRAGCRCLFFAAVSSACGTPAFLDGGSAALSCNLGDLQPSATVRVVLTFKPTAEGTFSPITGNLSANNDTVELNNTASTSIKVVSAPQLCAGVQL